MVPGKWMRASWPWPLKMLPQSAPIPRPRVLGCSYLSLPETTYSSFLLMKDSAPESCTESQGSLQSPSISTLSSYPYLESCIKFGQKGKCLLSKLGSFLPSFILGVLPSLGNSAWYPCMSPNKSPVNIFVLSTSKTQRPFLNSMLYSYTSLYLTLKLKPSPDSLGLNNNWQNISK